jgi:hypothetical protein
MTFYSWSGSDDLSGTQQRDTLDSRLSGVSFCTTQAAVTACLETLGSRYKSISCVLPVSVPYAVFMGVIRSGARPIVIDIDYETLGPNESQLREVRDTLKDLVAIVIRPGGVDLSLNVLGILQDVPTICVNDHLPVESKMSHMFTVYDMSVMAGSGAVVYHNEKTVVQDLKQLRHDSAASLPELVSALVNKRLSELEGYSTGDEYRRILTYKQFSGLQGLSPALQSPVFLARAPYAFEIPEDLESLVKPGIVPVYTYPVAKKRWPKDPFYPEAEKASKELILLPNHSKIDKEGLVEKLWTSIQKSSRVA